MNPLKAIGVIVMWLYDILMLPFVLVYAFFRAMWFVILVVVVLYVIWIGWLV